MQEVPATEDIACCAFRYALGRRTYMVSIVADWLIKNKSHWSESFKALMVREIGQAEIRGDLGMDCDRDCWFLLRGELNLSDKVS